MQGKRFRALWPLGVAVTLAVLPIAVATYFHVLTSPAIALLAFINVVGWSAVATAFIAQRDLHDELLKIATQSGIAEPGRAPFLKLFYSITRELERKNQALSVDLIERKISSRQELSRALEGIVGRAFKLLDAESAELALFDKESGAYHTSFVLGKPFSSSAQAMLAGASGEEESADIAPDIMIQPISFAGAVLGSLRIGLKRHRAPSHSDQELLRVLAVQGTLAIVNSRYNEEMLKMKRASDESLRAKTGFLANLSHEIRGPLGIILNAVEIVLDGLCGAVTDDQRDTLKMVRQNGEHLLELINDVLDYAKSESGKITPERVQIIVNDLLIDVSNVVRTQAQQKGHKLVCKPSDEALAILCDRRHIRQMMINLLTNSIKYTPSGGTIEVWAERYPGSKIKIVVQDSGVGIEPAQRHKVFAAFERVDNAYSIKQSGTGLGMPLTKRLAEVNGAMIDFDSTPGKGSRFWLIFPAVEYSRQAIAEQAREEVVTAVGHGERILIADEEAQERDMVVKYLEHSGFSVRGASSADEALELLRAERFDMLVLGNNLVDDANEKFLERVRAIPDHAGIPVVLVSSRAFIFDVEKYLKIGIDRCLSKPLSLKALGQSVREIIDARPAPARGTEDGGKEPRAARVNARLKSDDVLH